MRARCRRTRSRTSVDALLFLLGRERCVCEGVSVKMGLRFLGVGGDGSGWQVVYGGEVKFV